MLKKEKEKKKDHNMERRRLQKGGDNDQRSIPL
jgi:hypothetical protein